MEEQKETDLSNLRGLVGSLRRFYERSRVYKIICRAMKGGYVDQVFSRFGKDLLSGAMLVESVKDEYVEIVKVLLEYGADVHTGGDTPMYCAVIAENVKLIKLLLDHGADVKMAFEKMYVYQICNIYDAEVFSLVIRAGLNVKDLFGKRPEKFSECVLWKIISWGYWHRDLNKGGYDFVSVINENHKEMEERMSKDFKKVLRHRLWSFEILKSRKDIFPGDVLIHITMD